MKSWHKFVMILLIGSFPLALVLFQQKNPLFKAAENASTANVAAVKADLDSVFKGKEAELAEMDMRIVAARGEILKFESRRQELLGELQNMQSRIGKILEVNALAKKYEDK